MDNDLIFSINALTVKVWDILKNACKKRVIFKLFKGKTENSS